MLYAKLLKIQFVTDLIFLVLHACFLYSSISLFLVINLLSNYTFQYGQAVRYDKHFACPVANFQFLLSVEEKWWTSPLWNSEMRFRAIMWPLGAQLMTPMDWERERKSRNLSHLSTAHVGRRVPGTAMHCIFTKFSPSRIFCLPTNRIKRKLTLQSN